MLSVVNTEVTGGTFSGVSLEWRDANDKKDNLQGTEFRMDTADNDPREGMGEIQINRGLIPYHQKGRKK